MRVLVATASKHGATSDIGTAIAEGLVAAGMETTVASPDAVGSLEGYDGVVLGSGVYAGHWLGSAKDFADHHATALRSLPVWLFSSGPLGDPLKPDADPVDAASILTQVGARSHRVFGGRLDRSQLGMGERAMVALVRAPDGDYRQWDEIRTWTAGIAEDIATMGIAPDPAIQ
ncbi:MAG: flavodoxin domain-containing protein [Chloroflexi bacterium]|nr:flavodoxin domain-containing protein [Chloroflexota bacterium]